MVKIKNGAFPKQNPILLRKRNKAVIWIDLAEIGVTSSAIRNEPISMSSKLAKGQDSLDFKAAVRLRILIVFLFGLPLIAQELPQLTFEIFPLEKQTSPLSIDGFRPREGFAKGPSIVLRNLSKHAIRGFRLGYMASAPEACAQATVPHGCSWSEMGFEKTTVPVGATADSENNLLLPAALVWNAKDLGSTTVQVRIIVLEVEFEDGTWWRRLTGKESCSSIADSPTPTRASRCDPQLEEVLNQIRGVEYKNEPKGRGTPEGGSTEKYLITCDIEGHYARCSK